MKLRTFLIIVFSVGALVIKAQPAETTYPGIVIKSGYDNNVSYGPFNIGFSFPYYGNTYTQFYVSSNGLVTFGAGSTDGTEDPIPSVATPNNMLAIFWDDLVIDPSGNILYTTIGAAPNRKLIIQFRNMGFYTGPVYLGTFSAILYESGTIQFQYRVIILPESARAHGADATIGIENSDGSVGIEYAYRNPTAVETGKAISFVPSGPSYIMNTNAMYEGVYLTVNPTLPEPGITTLLSPAQGAVIGASHTFEWSAAEYTSNYSLRVSTNPNLSGATIYNAGSNLSWNVSDLALGQTYYWGVFASNATGTTWCEVRKFTTSSTPPLAGCINIIWAEQNQDKTISLKYTGGDASPKTAIITSLPGQGQLYQFNAGLKGAQITSPQTSVTDPDRNVIYTAPASSGNGIGNFNFKMNDAGGDSPEAMITINVSPPGIPSLLYVARGTGVEIQFDRPMNNPAGKETQFLVEVNGSPVDVTSANLKPGDNTTIVLTLASPLSGGESVNVSYTQGDATATTGGVLLSFTSVSVTLLAQSINFPDITPKKYGAPDYAPGATAPGGAVTYSSSNLSIATIVSNKVRFTGVGTITITARQAGSATYAPARFERPLIVGKGDQVITFNALTAKTYGDDDFLLTATSSSGLPVSFASDNSLVAAVAGNNVQINGAGSAIITASQSGNSLWNPAPDVPQTLTVNKVTLTVTAADATKPYLDPIPSFTFTIEGFINGETQSVIDVLPVASTTATAASDVGEYPITVSGGSDNNYDFSFVDGNLTITIINQTITFGEIPSTLVMGTPFEIPATSTSGLTVSFESQNTNIATITGNTLTGIARGTVNIRAFNARKYQLSAG